jgi:hypothetical protein
MAKLIEVLEGASGLSKLLFNKAGDATFPQKVQAALRSDAVMIVSATQVLTQRPLFGHGADPHYDTPVKEIAQATDEVKALTNTMSAINKARLEVVQAKEAMTAVTAH